ncbi:MAG TPA: hypothetical protein VIE43_06285 [Thermoanaerobaculia bacterium]|jgi:hypothetical protein|nr:hypothetical protein [Thermoanaerobaculia bacterium]
MSQPYGAAISGSSKESGQSHRSGPNFQFLSGLPSEDGATFTVTIAGTPNPGSVSATLYQDKSGSDKKIATVSNGSTFDVSGVDSSDNYYIADPSGATEDFVVYFTA